MMTSNRLRTPVFLVFGACAALTAQAWPDKTIKLITPSTLGGPPDAYARALADQLSKEFVLSSMQS